MRRAFAAVVATLALAGAWTVARAAGNVVVITLPAQNAAFKPGPNVALARENCLECHSSDYVYMQPPLTRAQWTTEVTKMVKAYGAPVPDGDVAPLVDYLLSQNGKPSPP
jgi:mono/diheme cytochrome c family protein